MACLSQMKSLLSFSLLSPQYMPVFIDNARKFNVMKDVKPMIYKS